MLDYTDVVEQEDDDATAQKSVNSKSEPSVLPGAHTIERFIVDEQLAILMNNLSFNRQLWLVVFPID